MWPMLRTLLRPSAVMAARSKSTFASSPIQVCVSDDGATIVCWHPEQPLRYEDTKPIPVKVSKFIDSVLRPEVHEEVDLIMRKTDLTQEDLMRLTYQPRRSFYRMARYYKRHVLHPDPPVDRIGI